MLSLWAKLAFVSSAAATCPDTLWAIARADHFGATGRPVQGIVVGEMMRGVGQDVCIETNAGGKNVDVQVYDLTMSLDSIKQGILDKLGAGHLCLWKKDGTLLSTGTLAAHGVSRGDNLYSVLLGDADQPVATGTSPPPLSPLGTSAMTLEGTTWAAKSWSGAAKAGGDPDPYDDEATIEVSGGTIRWTNGGGGGPYTVTALPASVGSPDSETIKFSINSEGDLVVEFGYGDRPATIVYELQGARTTSSDVKKSVYLSIVYLVVAGVLLAAGVGVGCCVGRARKRRRDSSFVVGLPVLEEGKAKVATVKSAEVGVKHKPAPAYELIVTDRCVIGMARPPVLKI